MPMPLRVLIVEDSASDAALMVRSLQEGGFDISHERVESALQMRGWLARQEWDAVLCDFSLPGFDAGAALAELHATGIDIPFIIVSGTIVEEAAIALMRLGAHDYVMKSNLARLAPAIERELAEGRMRREHRRAQAALLDNEKFQRAQLEVLVAARTAELERANQQMESFSYSVSHDLLAPVRAISGFAHLLRDDEAENLSENGRDYLERILRNTSKMGRLIDDVLNFSRLSRSDPAKHSVDMYFLAQSALDELRGGYPKARVRIGDLPRATGDRTILGQVFANLIGNALKYSASKERPEVDIGACPEGSETVYWVRDNGVGFDMRYAARLFGVFQRVHSEKDFPGNGLGLAIVKHIVERHGGRVWAEAKPDCGATFFFTLPEDIAVRPPAEEPPSVVLRTRIPVTPDS